MTEQSKLFTFWKTISDRLVEVEQVTETGVPKIALPLLCWLAERPYPVHIRTIELHGPSLRELPLLFKRGLVKDHHLLDHWIITLEGIEAAQPYLPPAALPPGLKYL